MKQITRLRFLTLLIVFLASCRGPSYEQPLMEWTWTPDPVQGTGQLDLAMSPPFDVDGTASLDVWTWRGKSSNSPGGTPDFSLGGVQLPFEVDVLRNFPLDGHGQLWIEARMTIHEPGQADVDASEWQGQAGLWVQSGPQSTKRLMIPRQLPGAGGPRGPGIPDFPTTPQFEPPTLGGQVGFFSLEAGMFDYHVQPESTHYVEIKHGPRHPGLERIWLWVTSENSSGLQVTDLTLFDHETSSYYEDQPVPAVDLNNDKTYVVEAFTTGAANSLSEGDWIQLDIIVKFRRPDPELEPGSPEVPRYKLLTSSGPIGPVGDNGLVFQLLSSTLAGESLVGPSSEPAP